MMNYLAGWLIFLIYLGFAIPSLRRIMNGLIDQMGDWVVTLLLIPYLLAVNFQLDWLDLLRIMIFLALPTLLLRIGSKKAKVLFQVLAILALWIPIEPRLFTLILNLITPGIPLPEQFLNLTLLPDTSASLIPGLSLPLSTIIAVCLALYLFLLRHPLKGIGFTFRIEWKDLKDALLCLTFYSAIGLPLGLGMGFLRFNPQTPSILDVVGGIVGGYLFVALIEEVLFRGVIQNIFENHLKNEHLAWIIASMIFGMAHLNNATQGFPVPNWAYVLMATFAGLAYGWVWRRSGKVTVSAITHMLVNLVWGLVLT
jgi:membrane protease YdiL (CAAX protease family)